jgi:NMD protein affecting ribosome stability and mRNA decay
MKTKKKVMCSRCGKVTLDEEQKFDGICHKCIIQYYTTNIYTKH